MRERLFVVERGLREVMRMLDEETGTAEEPNDLPLEVALVLYEKLYDIWKVTKMIEVGNEVSAEGGDA